MKPAEAFRKARTILSRLKRGSGYRNDLNHFTLNDGGELLATDAHHAIMLSIDEEYLPELPSERYVMDDFENKPHKADDIQITKADDKDALFVEVLCDCKSDNSEMVVATPSTSDREYPDLKAALPEYERVEENNTYSFDAELMGNIVEMLDTEGGRSGMGPKTDITMFVPLDNDGVDPELPLVMEGPEGLGVIMPLRHADRSSVKFDGRTETVRWIVKAKPKHWVALNENGELLVDETYRQRSDVLDLFGLTSDRLKRIEPGTYRVLEDNTMNDEVRIAIEQIREEAQDENDSD